MLITAEPKKFSITFKGDEIKMVRTALNLHRNNPGTRSSTITMIDHLLKRHNMFPKNRVMTIIEIKAIIYGIALMIAVTPMNQEELELGLRLISAMNGAIRQNVPEPILCPVYCFVSAYDNR